MTSGSTSAGSGVPFDWNTTVKPLLGATYGTFQPSDLVKLAKSIESNRDQIMKHELEFEGFYSLFVALATHHLCTNSVQIPKANLSTVIKACHVLAEFILDRLETPHMNCSVMPKQFVLLVKSLCKGIGFLQRSDIITLAALLKSSPLPPHIRATMGAEKLSEEESNKSRKKERTSSASVSPAARTETVLSNLLDLLSVPVGPDAQIDRSKDSSKPSTPTDSSKDVKEQFVSECMQHLTRLDAGSILIDVCLKLPFLARYNLMFRDMMRGEAPFSAMNANEFQSIFDSYSSFLNDVVMVSRVVVLPLLEPLTPDRLSKLCSLGCTCLLAACTVVIAYNNLTPKADADVNSSQELEAFTNNVVEKSLVIFATILSNIQSSQNVGGTQLQNMRALGAWCLTSALNHMLQNFEMNGAIICVAQQLLTLLQPLFADLKTDSGKSESASELTINSVLTPWQRFDYINSRSQLLSVLVAISHDSFLRGVDLLRGNRTLVKGGMSDTLPASKGPPDFEDIDAAQVQSIPNTPSESDSEPLLGSWLEELLSSVPQIVDSAVKQSAGILHSGMRRRTTATSESSTILGVKEDAHTYISLSMNCLRMLNDDLLCAYRNDLLKKSISSFWTEREIGYLATLIRTVDHHIQSGNLADEPLSEFKATLTKFVHNLIANGFLGDTFEVCLLAKLDIAIGSEDTEREWPLYLSPYLCGILCQVLLLKQNKERDESGHSETGNMIVKIWRSLMRTLKKYAFMEHDFIDIKDVNVEHLQVLLSLFHSLQLMQKKSVLLEVCKTIQEAVQENRESRFLNNNVSSHFTRILLIFEYLLRYFYEPPQALLQQLKKNVFPVQSQTVLDDGENGAAFIPPQLARTMAVHFICGEMEDVYRAEVPALQQVKMKPFFYNLAPAFSTSEVPKLDGLAATFIQNSFNYNDFYDCCCEMTNFYGGFSLVPSFDDRPAAFRRSVLRYCCTMIWRILKLLPPSVGFLQEVTSWTPANVSDISQWKSRVFLLCTGIRLSEAAFAGWVKDGLIKQGQTADQVDELVRKVSSKNTDSALILRLVGQGVESIKRNWHLDKPDLTINAFPSFVDMVYVDLLLCRAYALLDPPRSSSKAQTSEIPIQTIRDILTGFIALAHILPIERAIRSSSEPFSRTPLASKAALKLMTLCGTHPHHTSEVASLCWYHAHPSLRSSVEFWNRRNLSEFPAAGAWRNEFSQDFSPIDCYLDSVYTAHVNGLLGDWLSSLFNTVKRILHTSFHMLADIISGYPNVLEKKAVDQLMTPILFDVMTSHFSDFAFSVLTNVHGAQEHELLQECLYRHAIPTAYEIITQFTVNNDRAFESKVSENCLLLMQSATDVAAGRRILVYTLNNIGDVGSVIRIAVDDGAPLGFTTALVRLLGKMFTTADMVIHEKEYNEFCHNILKTFTIDKTLLEQLLNRVFIKSDDRQNSTLERSGLIGECCTFLDGVARSVNRASCESIETAHLLLGSIIPIMTMVLAKNYRAAPNGDQAGESVFTKLFYTLTRFASVGRGIGHRDLLKASTVWMKMCTERMSTAESLAQIKSDETNVSLGLSSDAICTIMNYLNELMTVFNKRRSQTMMVTYDSDISSGEQETDGLDEFTAQAEDDESGGDDSDEEALDSKLCTFTVTQKEFMNQHWYHCHTCGMVDGEGVCSICAKLCHKGHDLSYSKYGSFFCDCGAKGDPICQALVKRTKFKPVSKSTPAASDGTAIDITGPSGIRRSRVKGRRPKGIGDGQKSMEEQKKFVIFCGAQRERDALFKELAATKTEICNNLLEFLHKIVPAVTVAAESQSSIGNYANLRNSLKELHDSEEFRCETVDLIGTLTGGSQENAFENVNVKLVFSGDQGQTIKQLLMNHILHRACLACASSQNKRKQFLAVVHDRCKVAVLHLSSFLKQIENGKKKPSLTRNATESFPFTILSIAENPISEEYIAVCGLKECVIMTLTQSGSINDRLTLSLGLDVGNFVIKALWLPGAATELALVTADFVRVYDLAKCSTRAEYDFLLPAGKIRDATFICRSTKVDGRQQMERYLLLMTSSGYVYSQSLGPHCLNALHGSFYITDTLDIRHEELEESSGNIGGGGVSIYYNHSLQLLFTSYASGKNLFCSLTPGTSGLGTVKKVHFITWKSGQKSASPQALYRWSELHGHVGIMVALTQASQAPVVFYIRPRYLLVQEITLPPKAKVLDAVACRNLAASGDEMQSTVLLLCEDGSVRTVNISKDLHHWMKKPSTFRFPTVPTVFRVRNKRTWKAGDATASTDFPVDFFEQCQQLMEIEFGGSDLLQIYNLLQLRNRLQTTNLYVACAKNGGFQMEFLSRDGGMVICGVRIELGKHSIEKSPSFIEIFGRRKTIPLTHGRWIDIAFSKEESISTGNKAVITFGPTNDPSGVCVVDSVKVYGKTKDAFGWPDDIDEDVPPVIETRPAIAQSASVISDDQPPIQNVPSTTELTPRDMNELEKSVKVAFDTLASAFMTFPDSATSRA